MLQGDYRGSVSKQGPRELTFNPPTPVTVQSNCPACAARVLGVYGEDGGAPTLLGHGWYEFQTDCDAYWMQVNPADAETANPLVQGGFIAAGCCSVFFVDAARRDGCLVITWQETDDNPPYQDRPWGIGRVIRRDTTIPLSAQANPDQADLVPALESRDCDA